GECPCVQAVTRSLLRRGRDQLDAVVDREGVLLAALPAGLAGAHHGKERLRQHLAANVLCLTMALDQDDELQVALRAGPRGQIGSRGVSRKRTEGRSD